MGIFARLFGKGAQRSAGAPEQAVIVHLDGQGLPDEVYERHDLATLEERLADAIRAGALGEYDGNEVGPDETTLYLYGPDAERLFAGVEPVLRGYPLCRNARVVVRRGAPGAEEREVRL